MSKPSCPNSTSMIREISRPGTGAHRQTKLTKCVPKAINSTPTTAKQKNASNTPQVVPKEHHTWNHEDPPKDVFSHPQITLLHYTPHHGPHLSRNPVSHQGLIYSRYLYNQLPYPTNGCRNDGQTQTHDGGT